MACKPGEENVATMYVYMLSSLQVSYPKTRGNENYAQVQVYLKEG